MKLAFVVQRYGADIAGGSEGHCRALALRMSRSTGSLGDRPVTIGRLSECTIPLNDQNVSRRHAEIRPGRGAYVRFEAS